MVEGLWTFSDGFVIKDLQISRLVPNLAIVARLATDRVILQVQIHEALHPLEVVQLVELAELIALEIKDVQVLQEADVKQIVNLIVRDVELLQLLEGTDALHFFEFAASDVQHAYVLERGTDVHEIPNDRVIKLEELEAGQDLTNQLKVVTGRVDS